jgi:hypothetical protein
MPIQQAEDAEAVECQRPAEVRIIQVVIGAAAIRGRRMRR